MPAGSLLDFSQVSPEEVRGVKRGRPINWDALELMIRTTEGTDLQKSLMRRKIFKAIQKNGIESLAPQFRFHYCSARIALGDYSDYWGWEFRSGTDKGSEDWSAHLFWDETWLPKWGGGNINRLLVMGEQGLGDAIFHASMLPECLVRVNEVIFETENRLHGILERSFKRLKCRPEREFEDRRRDYGVIDAFIPAADLMRMFRRHASHFPRKPFLKLDEKRVFEMRGFTGKTAVSWKGRQGSIDPMDFGLESHQMISVQYGESNADIPEPPIDLKNDIEGVLAVLDVSKELITIPTSVHHMAGAIGKKTSIIHPTIHGEENQIKWDVTPGPSPFYPNVTVYKDVREWKSTSL
jgi:hypothetical protein